ncbi:DUF4430 domain-containing protein [Patescibacteria group bacterium]|nr:DUF4430 domain-containing protein [Patescibacteria group bacterium]
MSKKLNKFINLALFLALVALLIFRQKRIQEIFSGKTTQPAVEINSAIAPSAQLEFKVAEEIKESYQLTASNSAQNALELAQNELKLDLKEYDFGTMIEGVNGLMADNKHYWAIYQNGEYAKTGIAEIELNKGDKIELKYEEIQL